MDGDLITESDSSENTSANEEEGTSIPSLPRLHDIPETDSAPSLSYERGDPGLDYS